jgi:signal transduction histidine kinase
MTVAAFVACAGATIVVIALPHAFFARRDASAHLVLETVDSAIAVLVATLFYGRARRSRRLGELLVSYAMSANAIASGAFIVGLTLAGVVASSVLVTWTPLAVQFIGGVLFALASRATTAHRRASTLPWRDVVLVVGVLGAVVAGADAVRNRLPRLTGSALTSRLVAHPHLFSHPSLVGFQAVMASLFALAAVGFTRQARQTGDHLAACVGAAAMINSFAWLNYDPLPSLAADYIYPGTLMRTGFYLVLLLGAFGEITSYSRAVAQTAVLEERRRMARDFHDGLTQELTYAWGQLRALATRPGDRVMLGQAFGATERAMDEARRAIAALTRPLDEPLQRTLTQSAEEVASRYGASVDLQLEDVRVDAKRREVMIRIVREAVGNAVRHGGAKRVLVALVVEGAMRLSVSDTGEGFDPVEKSGDPAGFGLRSMQQRAESSGGVFAVESTPGEGTTVSVVWDA